MAGRKVSAAAAAAGTAAAAGIAARRRSRASPRTFCSSSAWKRASPLSPLALGLGI
jgi:hypothetical protein